MSATLGGTIYVSVIWTAGDVLTEAKLDNMVANDQAYDSHTAQGLLLNNTYSFASKNAAASANYNLARMNASDQAEFGDDGITALKKGLWDGWIIAGETWTYASADAPTFTMTVPSGAVSKYNVGDRIKLTQTTVKYFIVTAVADTTLTVYGGTDYTLVDATISANYYSHSKSPVGFPLDPTKWTILTTDTETKAKISPTGGVWYGGATAWGVGANITIVVPIGAWDLNYSINVDCISMMVTLSSTNNSETDPDLTSYFYTVGGVRTIFNRQMNKKVIVATKTTWYLMGKLITGNIETNNGQYTYVRATCAYL